MAEGHCRVSLSSAYTMQKLALMNSHGLSGQVMEKCLDSSGIMTLIVKTQ